MPTTFTTNALLQKPAAADRQWDTPLNANTDALDAMTAIGGLVVTGTEVPSATLQVRVAAGAFVLADGTVGQFGGTAALAVPPSATTYLWLDGTGALATGSRFPAAPHLRLAHVVAGASSLQQVVDERIQCAVAGPGLGFVLKTGDTMSGVLTIAASGSGGGGAASPVVVADPLNQRIGFFGASPATQAARTTPIAAASGSLASDTLADVGTSFTQATLNNNFASLAAKVDALILALQRHGLMAT